MVKRIVFLADIHAGSDVAPAPPGVSHDQTGIQRDLYRYWEEMVDYVGRVDAVVANGDLIDGPNQIEEGIGTWTTDIDLQARTAASLLALIKSPRYYILQGSGYHTKRNISGDRLVATHLSGMRRDAIWCGYTLAMDVDRVRFHVKHKVGIAPSALRSEREKIARHASVYGAIDVLVRSHKHVFEFYGQRGEINLVTPGFKGRDSFVAERNPHPPDVGFILFEVEGSNYRYDPVVSQITKDNTITKATL